MYAYAFCNPVMYSDYTGNWPKLSLIFTVIAVTAIAVAAVAATVATCGAAAPALALASGSIASSCVAASTATAAAAVATAVATDAMIVAGVSTAAGIASAVAERKIERRAQGNNTVYKLVDADGQAQYIGRTTNIEARERAHKRSTYRGGLKMEIIATDLDYYEARGLEQIAMLECHTINTSNRMNNRINGISPHNRKLALYMEAGRGVAGYLDNVISDEILYWTGN